ncbi:peroxisomal membrane anchor protein conserved region-domain-containing protein [Cadophora sp. MPI-SDFR-AT-0126]|nr:peroxisomal membrane anchor protein conserved region-domain-containing protein [Leotiomycetes sp. MPI-SDFR-AT-0126]
MSDSDPPPERKAAIPAWQIKAASQSAKTDEPVATQKASSRETVIAQARKFLEEDEVRDASTDKKIAFLESKGLGNEEIQELLGVTRNTEASNTSEASEPTPTPSTTTSSPPPPQPAFSPPQYHAPSQPPIITYPEFLTTPPHPTPLITKPRLLTTLYAFSGLTSLLYGTHNYLITPMLASLTEARLSFASTSKTNLDKLITQLEGLVSEVPASMRNKSLGEKDDESESDEDPAEMFHRDIGIQTSPFISRPSSPVDTSPLTGHTARLQSLKSTLEGLVEDSSIEGVETVELEGKMGVLREYLDGLAFVRPSYSYGPGVYGGGGRSGKDDDDEIGKLKKEIRGVKGVLLSARSFPGVVRAGGR